MSGGTVVVNGPTMGGNGSIDVNGGLAVSGGTLLAVGSSGMAEAPETTSSQGWVSFTLSGSQQPGSTLSVVDAGGEQITEFTPGKTFGSVIFSSDAIKSGQSYTLKSGSTTLATATAGQHSGGMGGGPGGGRRF